MAHSNIETLYEHVPKRLLPSEYGGDAGPLEDIINYWEKKMLEYRDFLMDESKYGTDESKRAVHSNLAQSIYGVKGTFKQLDFD